MVKSGGESLSVSVQGHHDWMLVSSGGEDPLLNVVSAKRLLHLNVGY